jgi:hypothetical protein
LPTDPPVDADPAHEHLFHPGHADTARLIVARGWPRGYLAVCVVCGRPVDLVALLGGAAPETP